MRVETCVQVFAVFGTVISGAVVGLGIYYLGEHGLVYRLRRALRATPRHLHRIL